MGLFRANRRSSLFPIYLVISSLVISCVWTSFSVSLVAGEAVHDIAVTSVKTNTTVVAPGQAVNVTVHVENQGDFDETFNVSAYYNSSLIGTQNDVSLNAGNSTVMTFIWSTAGVPESINVMKANATIVPGETETTDNEHVNGTVTVTWKKVYVSPTPVSENKPNLFTISLNIFNVTDLWGWSITLRWKRGVLSCIDAVEGPFLSKNGTQQTWWTPPVIDNLASPPRVILSNLVSGMGVTGVSGNGTLANVRFSVDDSGNCTLELYEVNLVASGYTPMPPNTGPPNYHFPGVEHGYFYTTHPVASLEISPDPGIYLWQPIVGETVTFNASESYDPDDPYDSTPGGVTNYNWDLGDGTKIDGTDPIVTHTYAANDTYWLSLNVTDDDGESSIHTRQLNIKLHDIALINVTAYPTEVAAGATLTINATVLNEGSTAEYLNITVYYNYDTIEERVFSYAVDSTVKVTLATGKNGTCTIPWNTTGVTPGTYMIGATVELIRDSALYQGVSLDEWEADKTDNTMFAGTITVVGAPTHDLAVTAVTVNPENIRFGQAPDISVTVRNEGNRDETFNATVYYNSTLVGTEEDVMLSAGGSTTLAFAWAALVGSNTTQEGVYLIVANVTILANETDTADNSRNITRTIRLLPYATFIHSPITPAAGQTVTFDASLSYFPGIPPPGEPPKIIYTYQWDFGDGTESTEKFPTRVHTYSRRGTYTVTLTVADNRGLTGTYSKTVSVGHDHDVAVTNVTPLSTEATTGGQVSINVTVTNKGTSNETVTISAYYDDTAAASTQSATLSPDANATLTFVWDTAGVAGGSYTIKAIASQVTGETYLEDNTLLSDRSVTILKSSSSITLSASTATLTIGGSSTLSGSLTPELIALDVTIWIKASGGDWSEHVTVMSDENGEFSYSWAPPSAGSYAFKVSWPGDDTTQAAESDVQVVDVQEALTSNMFLYSTIAFAVLCGVIAVYFIWVRKPRPA